MSYKENPKTKGSGILCIIPQSARCPLGCEDCFFQSGRSYLEPLEGNLPNIPPLDWAKGCVIRVNDGNDSNVDKDKVVQLTEVYINKFYNTSIPRLEFDAPVVLTVNPGGMTGCDWYRVYPIPKNLMFVRVRTNTWNIAAVVRPAIRYYTKHSVPVVLTFMAYYEGTPQIPEDYSYRKRTLNSYWVITQEAWDKVVREFKDNPLVYTCGKDADTHQCLRCGNCLREYFATKERMRYE